MSDPTGTEPQSTPGPTPADPTPTPDSPSEASVPVAASGKHPIFEYAESIAKLTTVILGVLYVLGLLISNFQLMELGISDFASLQARNILAGVVFVVHVAWMLLALALIVILVGVLRFGIPISIAEGRQEIRKIKAKAVSVNTKAKGASEEAKAKGAWEKLKAAAKALDRLVEILIGLISVPLAILFVAWLAGEVIGYLYPWGQPFTLTGRDFWANFTQFASAYVQFNFALASLVILMALLFVNRLHPFLDVADKVVRGRKAVTSRRPARPAKRSPGARVFGYALLSAVVLPLLMVHYADEVYPNFKYNLGGGQPQVAELLLAGKKADLAGLNLGGTLCCEGNDPDRAISTGELVIWYQSDKFVYVSRLDKVGPEPAQVSAIDLKLVRNIRYLPKYVEVYSGARIKQIYQRTPAGVVPVPPVKAAPPLPRSRPSSGRSCTRTAPTGRAS